MCSFASYQCCEKTYKFCAANFKKVGKIATDKMFFAPFGCKWRNTNTWNFNFDPELGNLASLDRRGHYAYLNIVKKTPAKTSIFYRISG
jgi:hypothetical protein